MNQFVLKDGLWYKKSSQENLPTKSSQCMACGTEIKRFSCLVCVECLGLQSETFKKAVNEAIDEFMDDNG